MYYHNLISSSPFPQNQVLLGFTPSSAQLPTENMIQFDLCSITVNKAVKNYYNYSKKKYCFFQ